MSTDPPRYIIQYRQPTLSHWHVATRCQTWDQAYSDAMFLYLRDHYYVRVKDSTNNAIVWSCP